MNSNNDENDSNGKRKELTNSNYNFNMENNLINILSKNNQIIEEKININQKALINDSSNSLCKSHNNNLIKNSITKKPSVQSLINYNTQNKDLINFDLNNENKKYNLFEDFTLQKIYDDIQKDISHNLIADNSTKKNFRTNNDNFPGIIYAKKKPTLSNILGKNSLNKQKTLIHDKSQDYVNDHNKKTITKNVSKDQLHDSVESKDKLAIIHKKPVNEEDLFLSMSKRLNLVEAQLKEYKILLDEKKEENSLLRNKINDLENKFEITINKAKKQENYLNRNFNLLIFC